MTPTSTSDVKLTVAIENESPKNFVFETVNPRPQTLLTPNFDPNSITLTSHRESTPVSMTFTGTIESDDIEPIEISVKNCEITLSDKKGQRSTCSSQVIKKNWSQGKNLLAVIINAYIAIGRIKLIIKYET